VAEAAFPPALLDALKRDAVHVEDVRKALEDLHRRCDASRLPEALRSRFLDLVAASRLERDIE
jgi:hypothetical protein